MFPLGEHVSKIGIISGGQIEFSELKTLDKKEVVELILRYPRILPHLRSTSLLVYPRVMRLTGSFFKTWSIIMANLRRKLELFLILFEYYDSSETLSLDPFTIEEFKNSWIYRSFKERVYDKIIKYMEKLNLCRTKATWAKNFREWLEKSIPEASRDIVCRDIYVGEVTLLFRELNSGIEYLVRSLNDDLDIRFVASEIRRIDLNDGRIIIIGKSYVPPKRIPLSSVSLIRFNEFVE
ncbi:MAG: hypothetical protein QXS45_03960 [Sulfolobales archaeon]